MKLSCAYAYALRSLVFLARRDGAGLVPSAQIAEAEGFPERFLVKVLRSLVSWQVLLSLRGHGGGYRLARPARSITLLQVVEAVEGPVRGEAPAVGGREHTRLDAGLRAVCDDVAEAVRRRLGKVSLDDLAGEG